MARKRGSVQARPNKSGILDYYRTLKQRADQGATNTTGSLFDSHHMTGKKEGQSNA